MSDVGDWRLQGQEAYLKGVRLRWRHWVQEQEGWDHDHCEFCGAKFGAAEPGESVLKAGYNTSDGYRWICEPCFGDFRPSFGWVVVA